MKYFKKIRWLFLFIVACALLIILTCSKDENPVKEQNPPPSSPSLSDPGSVDNDGNYTVSWSTVNVAENYILQEATNQSFSNSQVVYNGSSTSKSFSNKPNGTYFYRVNCSNNDGISKWSNTVDITVQLTQPMISVLPVTLDFGTNETRKSFNITNSGTGTLNWQAIDNRTWIKNLTPNSGSTTSETDHVNVTISRNNMSYGIYDGRVDISSNGGNKAISILMTISANPKLRVSVNFLDYDSTINKLYFNISNWGDSILCWSASASESWILIEPDSGEATTETELLTVSIDRSGLDCDLYSDKIMIYSNGGTDSIEVKMKVSEDPELFTQISSLDFGSSETNLCISLTNINCKCGEINWFAGENCTWLSVLPNSGILECQIQDICASVDRNGLPCGSYSHTITILTQTGQSIPIQVIMCVIGDPELQVSTSYLHFWEDETILTFDILNKTPLCDTLDWSISNNQSWLLVTPPIGETISETDQITLSVDRQGLNAGTYSDTISINSNGGTDTIAISMDVTCNIEITKPNSEDTWSIETVFFVVWKTTGSGAYVKIELYKNSEFQCILWRSTPNSGRAPCTLGGGDICTDSDYRIKITDLSDINCYDFSDYFTITAPCLEVTIPYTGINWCEKSNVSIEWDPSDISGSVSIDLYAGLNYLCSITSSTPNNGSYSWTVDDCGHGTMDDYRIKVTSLSDASYYDFSDNFQITARNIGVQSPSSGDNLCEPDLTTIQWVSDCVPSGTNVKIETYKGSSRYRTITQSNTNDGSFNWRVDAGIEGYGTDYRIKVISIADPSTYDYSDYFTIEPCITITEPDPGDIWSIGDRRHILWQKGCAASGESAKIELYKGDDLQCVIISDVVNDGDWIWTVSDCEGEASSQYWIAIISLDNSYCYGITGYFTIQ